MKESKVGSLPSPKAQSNEEPTVEARVRPGNRYAGAVGGQVISVAASELKRVPHALIALDEEARLKVEAAKPKPPTAAQSLFRGLKRSAIRSAEAAKEARAQLTRNHLASLGIKVG